MSVVLGTGEWRYRVVEDWAEVPEGWQFMDVAAVAVDSKDQVYVFNRGEHPMMVFDRDGRFLRSFGEELFTRAHGLHIGPDDLLYCTDDGDHTVRKMTPEGKLLMQIGVPGEPAPFMSNLPFHRCTHTALAQDGHIFVSDGYGNACVHKYAPDGRHVMTFGEPGTDPGQFNLVHNIVADDAGWIYVADRENHRVQVFDTQGRYEAQWTNMHRPSGLYMQRGPCPHCVIGELGPGMPVNRQYLNIGPRLSIMTAEGEVVARLGGEHGPGQEPGKFLAPHGLAMDSRGAIYVGEVSYTNWPSSFGDAPRPKVLRTLQKLEPVQNDAPVAA
ncbi:MAG: peptidyl-alpha-hydroxyglycine alpha-amidating lyase family protein [Pseudomonadota bacterium]